MSKYFFLLLAVMILGSGLGAAQHKSAAKAMLFSALLPGSGQAYLGSYTKTGIFLSTELLLVGTAFRLSKEVDWAVDTYQQYACHHAGVPLHSDKVTYQNVQDYISNDEYNAAMQHDAWRYFVLIYNDLDAYYDYVQENRIDEEEGWNWSDNKTWMKYRDYRTDKQNLEMYSNLAVAAVVLNHLVGIIDTALTAGKLRRIEKKHSIYIDPDLQNNGMRMGYAYRF